MQHQTRKKDAAWRDFSLIRLTGCHCPRLLINGWVRDPIDPYEYPIMFSPARLERSEPTPGNAETCQSYIHTFKNLTGKDLTGTLLDGNQRSLMHWILTPFRLCLFGMQP
jgi:hypothetical protein